MRRWDARVEKKDAPAPDAIAAVVERSGPRRPHPGSLEAGRAEDDGERDDPGQQVRVGAAVPPPARGGDRRAVAGDARNEGRRLADSERKPIGGAQVVLGPLLWRPVGEEHRDRSRKQPRGDRARAAEAPLDVAFEPIADDRRWEQ